MTTPHPRPAGQFEVDDPEAAFRKLEAFAKRVLAVPKKHIDKRLSREAPKDKRKS